ncbi:MAG: SDR family NAD(P)-dependent oxidoreductase [Candidatus Bipolaricaulota bacterium]
MTGGHLAGKVVLITGASSGIGAGLARACSHGGARVALVARSERELMETARDCPGETAVLPGDATCDADRKSIVGSVVRRWGGLDILVNSAGIGCYGAFDELEERDLRDVLEINLVAAFRMTQEALRVMRVVNRGLILQVASTGGLIAHAAKVSAYLASKHALVGMSRGLRRDLEGTGIRVQVACPHLTDTPFFGRGHGAEEMKAVADSLRDRMDTADEVAQGIVKGMDSDRFVIFPTSRARAAYERFAEGL